MRWFDLRLSHWLHKGLTDTGFGAVLMETRGPCEPVAINKPPKQLAPFNKGATPYDRRL